MSNKSKYHKIIIDEDKQSGISNARYNLTVEEFYDLMHHTHNAEDIIGLGSSSGGSTGDNTTDDTNVKELVETINQLKTTIEGFKTTMSGFQDSVDKFNDYIEHDIQIEETDSKNGTDIEEDEDPPDFVF